MSNCHISCLFYLLSIYYAEAAQHITKNKNKNTNIKHTNHTNAEPVAVHLKITRVHTLKYCWLPNPRNASTSVPLSHYYFNTYYKWNILTLFPIHAFKVETARTTLLSQLSIFFIKRILLYVGQWHCFTITKKSWPQVVSQTPTN